MARILLINDEADLIAMCEIVLEARGHSVRHLLAPHRTSELLELASWKPELVLLDLVMPGATGEDVLERLRDLPGMSDVPVVVMSAVPEAEARARAMGAAGVLEKPFDPDGLMQAVDGTIALARAPRSLGPDSSPDTERHHPQR